MIIDLNDPTVQLVAGHFRVSPEAARALLDHIPEWWRLGWNALQYELHLVRRDA